MATLLLSAAGAAIGAGFGGSVLGLSGAVIGRAIGATIGRSIDQRVLGGGSDAVEVGRIDRLRLTGASEGAPIGRVWGRMRIAGQVIWATEFKENISRRGRGKGTPKLKVNEYSYTVSLAIALCEGEILKVGRIWTDGNEIAPDSLNLRVYLGSETQLPDPRIEAVEGAGKAPAYRGMAYVVIEDLDLTPFGNRVPQFSFEVVRPATAQPGQAPALHEAVRAVALIPGTGEYALATTAVHINHSPGRSETTNVQSASGQTDFSTSLEQLVSELPNCGSVSLVVSWFGDDLRCGTCQIRPKVEQSLKDGVGMPWRAGGIARSEAQIVPKVEGRSIYGGTPADAAVIEAIRAIRAEGREVMFYPFILMEQLAGNDLPDPWTSAVGQPALPWRGRITTSIAPGKAGTTDRTAIADAEVATFFGEAEPDDFHVSDEVVSYSGPAEWGFRRFILHYATLCAAAGGVDAFCIGSEMRSLVQIRGANDSFPTVAALVQLAKDVRSILGTECKISYAADWSEYADYKADGNLHFPLDPLWASPDVDFVGIDNYMPLSDWRDEKGHADAAWGSVHNIHYLRANIAGGEFFDWFYDSKEGEEFQRREPIEDGAHGEPWVFRAKDLVGWWSNAHHERRGSERRLTPTAWVPMSKPIRFTEYGCAAIDKGSNQPNKFLDRLSSESGLPRKSNGHRDDLVQLQYLRAMAIHWTDPACNPISPIFGAPMVDMARSHVWAWDSRPFPSFPARSELWSDATSYARGHWLNGRATNQPLDLVVREICGKSGVDALNTSNLNGFVRGYAIAEVQTVRSSLQPLMLGCRMEATERDGMLNFDLRDGNVAHVLDVDTLAVTEELDGYAEISRLSEPDTSATIRIGYIDVQGDFEVRAAEARYPDQTLRSVSASELSLGLTAAEARGLAYRWLVEQRIGRDTLRLALPPSSISVGVGDIVQILGARWRVDLVESGETIQLDVVRVEGGPYEPIDMDDEIFGIRNFVAPVPTFPVFLDLPLVTGEEIPHSPHLAIAAEPWPGLVGLWSSAGESGFELNRVIDSPSIIGKTESSLDAAAIGVWDRGQALRMKLVGGALTSAEVLSVLNGTNAMAIGDGLGGDWEVFQFASAELVAPDTFEVSMRLRGQLGTDGVMPPSWPIGSTVVLLDRSVQQIELASSARGLVRQYRIGVASRGYDDPTAVSIVKAFDGVGLRPYPICHLRSTGSVGSEVEITWIRRTRIEGDNWQQSEVPLGEENEAYVVRILSGGAIIATYEVGATSFHYPPSAQANDGISGPFAVSVAQVSSRFGPGPFRVIAVAS